MTTYSVNYWVPRSFKVIQELQWVRIFRYESVPTELPKDKEQAWFLFGLIWLLAQIFWSKGITSNLSKVYEQYLYSYMLMKIYSVQFSIQRPSKGIQELFGVHAFRSTNVISDLSEDYERGLERLLVAHRSIGFCSKVLNCHLKMFNLVYHNCMSPHELLISHQKILVTFVDMKTSAQRSFWITLKSR